MNIYPVPELSVFKFGRIKGVGGVKEPAHVKKHLEYISSYHNLINKHSFIVGN